MRRLAVVGSIRVAERDAAAHGRLRGWLDTLPSAGVRYLDRLEDVSLDRVDVLWLRDRFPRRAAAPWLRAGGRLLATEAPRWSRRSASIVASRTVSPPDPLPAASAWPPSVRTRCSPGCATARSWRAARRPHCPSFIGGWPAGNVVAVERRGLAPDPGRVLAWEYRIGDGGLLCLGPGPLPMEATARDDELVLANALVGDAIPHRDRISPAAHWPSPGRQAVHAKRAAASLDSGPRHGRRLAGQLTTRVRSRAVGRLDPCRTASAHPRPGRERRAGGVGSAVSGDCAPPGSATQFLRAGPHRWG